MLFRLAAASIAALALSACASLDAPPPTITWARSDGVTIAGVDQERFNRDYQACEGEYAKAALGAFPATDRRSAYARAYNLTMLLRSCMEAKGYGIAPAGTPGAAAAQMPPG